MKIECPSEAWDRYYDSQDYPDDDLPDSPGRRAYERFRSVCGSSWMVELSMLPEWRYLDPGDRAAWESAVDAAIAPLKKGD